MADPRRRVATLTFDGITSEEFYALLPDLLAMIEDAAEICEDQRIIRALSCLGSYNAAYTPRWRRASGGAS